MAVPETTPAPGLRRPAQPSTFSVQAILPAHNEAENLPDVVTELASVLADTFGDWGILVVDDGSTDGTTAVLAELCERVPELRWMRLPRRSGKSQALQAAFSEVRADLVLLRWTPTARTTPARCPSFLEQIETGSDLVAGRRATRRDRALKRVTSKFYNWCTARLTGIDGSDFNSGFKLMRREVVESVNIYGELHRYIPRARPRAGAGSTSARSGSTTASGSMATRSSAATASGVACSTC
ncbi:MAG: glycosyltransferase family 2 protein [Acidimicrobiia bacterium]|nr:glycosyltransferase family 2 protein [Acidimicrobiia bacterium]